MIFLFISSVVEKLCTGNRLFYYSLENEILIIPFQHFKYPLSLTMAHLVTKFMLAAFIRVLIELKTGKPRVILPWGMFCKRIAPAGMHMYYMLYT